MPIFSRAFPRLYEWLRNTGGRRTLPRAVRNRGILFIHIPKNAGTSISHALYSMEIGHHPIHWYRERFPHSMRKLPSFAVVRDPVTRFLSAFSFLKTGGLNEDDARFAREMLSDFDHPLSLAEACLRPGFWKNLQARHHHFKTQRYFVEWRGNRAVDQLLRFESLPACLTSLPVPSDWQARLERRNPTKAFPVQPEHSSLQNVLEKICPEDFDLWRSL